MKKKFLMVGLLMSIFLFVSCAEKEVNNTQLESETTDNGVSSNEADVSRENNKIYTTIYPIEFIVDRLVGEHIEVKSAMPEGGDIHTFEISQKTLIDIAESDMYMYLGLGIELNYENVGNALKNENVEIFEVGQYIEGVEAHDHDHDHGEHEEHEHEHEEHEEHEHEYEEHEHEHKHAEGTENDAHIWMDPMYVLDMSEIIKEKLIEEYPSLENSIVENFENLESELIELDEAYYTQLENNDLDVFVVSHDKFLQWKKYGLDSIAVKDEAHSKDPSAKEVQAIIETINDLEIQYVVFENNVPCMPLDRIKTETNTEKVVLSSLGTRSKTEREKGKDYITLMQENLETLEIILNK